MTMASQTLEPRRESVPSCFGKDWDNNAVECAGGADPNYADPRTGSHVRAKCDYFTTCGGRTYASKQASRLIPPENLTQSRPPVVTPPPVQRYTVPSTPAVQPPQQTQQTVADQLRASSASWVERQRLAALGQTIPVTQQPAQVPLYNHNYPASSYQLNYMMPNYLSVPEVRGPGESIWSVLLREALRAMAKALGHAIAHFFDANVIRQPTQPPEQQQ